MDSQNVKNSDNMKWLTVGKSFKLKDIPRIEKTFIKKETISQSRINKKDQKNVQGEDFKQQERKFFNLENRPRASDLISSSSSSTSRSPSKKQQKKDKKKKDKKSKKERKKVKIDNQQLIIHDDKQDYQDIQVQNFIQTFDINARLLFNYEIKKGLYKITLMRFGEQSNYDYGLKMYDIPKYRRIQYNIILGLQSDHETQSIIDELNLMHNIESNQKPSKTDGLRFFELKSSVLNEVGLEIMPIGQQDYSNQDFISLKENKIQKFKQEFEIDDSQMESREARVMKKTKIMNENIKKEPDNLNYWMELIDFQDDSLQYLKNSQAIIEKKLSILDKMMENKNIKNHPLTILTYLKFKDLSNKNDDFFKIVLNDWERFIDQNRWNLLLWNQYLDFKLSNFSRFSALYVRDSIDQIFEKFLKAFQQNEDQQQKYKIQKILNLFIRKLVFKEKEMGYSERAMGILIGQIELNICYAYQYSGNDIINDFQSYWESEDSFRCGELDFINKYDQNDKQQLEYAIKNSFIGLFEDEHLKKYETIDEWCEIERLNSISQYRPANQMLEKKRINHNPDSFVLFEDIQKYIYIIEGLELKQEAIGNFLELMNFPPLNDSLFESQETFSHLDLLHQDITKHFLYIKNQKSFKLEKQISKIEIMTFDLNHKFNFLNKEYDTPEQQSKLEYVRRVMALVAKNMPIQTCLIYYMNLESVFILNYSKNNKIFNQQKAKQSRNNIKKILQSNEQNLNLWMVYAEIEYLQSPDRALKIIQNCKEFAHTQSQKLFVAYFHSQFILRSSQDKNQILKIIKNSYNILNGQKEQPNDDLKSYEILQIIKYFESELIRCLQFSNKKQQKKLLLISRRTIIFFFYNYLNSVCQASDIKQRLNFLIQMKNYYHNKLLKQKDHPYIYESKSFKYDNQIQISYLNVIRSFQYKFLNLDERKSLFEIVSEAHKNFPFNKIFFSELIKINNQITLKAYRIQKLKMILFTPILSSSQWTEILLQEINKFKGEEDFNNTIKFFIQQIHKIFEQCQNGQGIYDRAIEIYRKNVSQKFSEKLIDINFIGQHKLMQLMNNFNLYFNQQSEENIQSTSLVQIQKAPSCKEFYINYIQSSSAQKLQEIIQIIHDKEIRLHEDPLDLIQDIVQNINE